MVQSAATGELGSHGTIMTACEAAAVGVAVSLRPAGQGVPGSLCLNCLLQASAPFINCRAQFPHGLPSTSGWASKPTHRREPGCHLGQTHQPFLSNHGRPDPSILVLHSVHRAEHRIRIRINSVLPEASAKPFQLTGKN